MIITSGVVVCRNSQGFSTPPSSSSSLQMSTLCGNKAMDSPLFGEMRRQASFFLKEKLRSARLVFTDVTPAELMAEEVTNGSSWAPDVRAMGLISKAAFEIGDYWRIVEVLHKRLANFDKKNWRQSYQALVLLEYLLTHGPESVCREFESDKEVIKECGRFQYIDERGFNWGLAVRNKSDRILKFLGERQLLKEERQKARKLSLEIRGFGSFSQKSSNSETEDCTGDRSYQRCNSELSGYGVHEDSALTNRSSTEINKNRSSSEFSTDSESPSSSAKSSESSSIIVNEQLDESNCMAKIKGDLTILNKIGNLEASEDRIPEEHDNDWDQQTQESQPLLHVQKDETVAPMDWSLRARNSHPFDQLEAQSRERLLSAR